MVARLGAQTLNLDQAEVARSRRRQALVAFGWLAAGWLTLRLGLTWALHDPFVPVAGAVAWQPDAWAPLQPLLGALIDLGLLALAAAWAVRGGVAGAVAAALAGLQATAQVAGIAHVLAAGGHVEPWTLWHLQPGLIGVAVEAGAPLAAALALAVGLATWRLLRFAARRWQESAPSRDEGASALGPASAADGLGARRARLVGTAGAVVVSVVAIWAPPHPRHGAALPGLQAVAAALELFRQGRGTTAIDGDSDAGFTATLPKEAATRLQTAGLLPAGVDPGAAVPMFAPALQRSAPITALRPTPRRLVVVLIESLTRGATSLAGPAATGRLERPRTPTLEALARRGVEVRGWLPAAQPTHAGIVATLCSVPAASFPIDSLGAAAPTRACLPDRLRPRGHRSAFFHGSPLRYTGLDALARQVGFDEALGSEELIAQPRGPDPPPARSPWGIGDRDLYAAALAWLDALPAASPATLVIATSDSHLPGHVDARCTVAANGVGWADAIACSDEALAGLVAGLDVRGLGRDLLLAVTADHAAPPWPEVLARTDAADAWWFADVPLLLVGPGLPAGRHLDRDGTSLDLAPTLLGLLGVGDRRGFLGQPHDLLAALAASAPAPTPRQRRLLLGLAGRRRIGLRLGEQRWQGPAADLQAGCASGEAPPMATAVGLMPCDLPMFLDWIDALWQQDRLAPRLSGHDVSPGR